MGCSFQGFAAVATLPAFFNTCMPTGAGLWDGEGTWLLGEDAQCHGPLFQVSIVF